MKRILFLLTLLLALVACKKNKQTGYLESDVVGEWVCNEWTDKDGNVTTNPDYCVDAMRDHKVIAYWDGSSHNLYWELKGERLIITGSGGGEVLPEVYLTKLDKKHADGIFTFPDGTRTKASFSNATNLLPGVWKCTVGENVYRVTILWDESSIWVEEGREEIWNVRWRFGTYNDSRVKLIFEGVNIDLVYNFVILSASDNEFDMLSASGDPAKFVRL